MPVIIYGFHASPPVRAVLITAKAIGLEVELKPVNIFQGENKTEEYLNMNPAHTVPTMDDDGFYLAESRAIMIYLVEKYGKDDKLYPKDVKKRAVVNNMLYFDASSLCSSFMGHYGPQIRLGKPSNPDTEATMKDKLSILEAFLGRRPFAAGDQLTLADFSIAASLSLPQTGNIDFSAYPNVVTWYDKIKQLPYFDEASKVGLDSLRCLFASKGIGK